MKILRQIFNLSKNEQILSKKKNIPFLIMSKKKKINRLKLFHKKC